MDRTGRHTSGELCQLVWRSEMGFYSKSLRFEGGGRDIIGLNRTGKSCRLRWVNYLHPGLKRGKMTPQEERLVLELHSKWGNRWSKIAKKLPGRTDNEIKNYWRTHMRKKAQERKRFVSPSSSSSNYCCSATCTDQDSSQSPDSGKASFYDTGGFEDHCLNQEDKGYSMDDIWKEIDQSEANIIKPVRDIYAEQSHCPPLASLAWERESSLESIWSMDEDEIKIPFAIYQLPLCSVYHSSPSSSSLAG